MNLLNSVKIWKKTGSGSTGVGTALTPNTTFIDMSQWNGCLFLLVYATTCAGSSGVVKLQQTTGQSTAGAGAVASSFPMSLGSTNRVAALDFCKPIKRYARLTMVTGTGIVVVPITYAGRQVGSTELLQYVKGSSGQGVTRVVLGASAY